MRLLTEAKNLHSVAIMLISENFGGSYERI